MSLFGTLIAQDATTPGGGSPPYPLIGTVPNVASLGSSGFASVADAVSHYDTAWGGATCFRTFSSGAIGTWSSGQVGQVKSVSNASVWHSFKTWDPTAITAWINGKPNDGVPALLTFHHEPENDGWDASQILTWKQRVSDLVGLRDATGRTDVQVGPILMSSWTLNSQSGRDFWGDWYVGPAISGYTPGGFPGYAEQDFYGWDPYNQGWKNSTPLYADPDNILNGTNKSILEVHQVTGLPLGIGEYGSPQISSDTDDSGRAQHITDYLNYCINNFAEVKAMCYWSDYLGGAFDPRINASPTALAAIAPFAAASRAEWGIS